MNKLLQLISKNKFIRNIGIYTISDVLNKLVPFLLLPVLTRYLTPSDYGIIAIFGVFISILGVFISIESHTAVGVSFFKQSKEQLKLYIGNVLLLVSITTSLVLIVVALFNVQITQLINLPLEWLIIGVFVTVLNFITTINLILWQSEHKPINFGIYQIGQTILNLMLSLILIIGFLFGWEGRLLAASFAAIVFGFMSLRFLFNRNYVNLKYDRKSFCQILNFGLPMVPHALAEWIRTGVDRFLLTLLISTTATGLYAVGFQVASVISVVVVAFNKAYTPFLYEKLKTINLKGKQKLVKLTYIYFLFLLLLVVLVSFVAPYLMDWFLGRNFKDAQNYIFWFSLAFALYGMNGLLARYIYYVEKTVYLSYVTFFVGILHVGLSYILISNYGILGAAQSYAIITLITLVAVWIISNKLYPMPWTNFWR